MRRRMLVLVLGAGLAFLTGCKDPFGLDDVRLPRMCNVTYAGPECGYGSAVADSLP